MKNQNVTKSVETTNSIASKGFRIAKFAIVAVIVSLSIVGGYVVANTSLRNQTIDFAQNQHTAQAAALPKE